MDEPTQLQPVQAPHVEGNARCCRVPGCTADLASETDYSGKHRVCKAHRKASVVTLPEGPHKWCQGCTGFRVIELFVQEKGRCDNCLDKIRKSRKRVKADTDTEDSDIDSDSGCKYRSKGSRLTKQAKPSRKGNPRTAAKQQKPSTERKARKACDTSTSPPSSPMSTHTELYAADPHLLQHHVPSGPSASVGLTPSHIPHAHSLGNPYASTQTQWSVQVASPAVPSQLQLASTASLGLCGRRPACDAGYHKVHAHTPYATYGARDIDNTGCQPVPYPYGSTLPLGLPPSPAPPCTSPATGPGYSNFDATASRLLPWLQPQHTMQQGLSNSACGGLEVLHSAAVPAPVGGPATEPLPDFDSIFSADLSLHEGTYDLSQHVDCLPALPNGLDMGAIFSDDVLMWPEQIPAGQCPGLLTIGDDQLLHAELQSLLDGM